MALPRFFDKTALAASHVLRGFDQQAFAEALGAQKIAVFFDSYAEEAREGRWTLELTINLLARLYPAISIISAKGDSNLLQRLCSIAKEINPQIEIRNSLEATSSCLVVGRTAPARFVHSIFVGSEGWITKVSSHAPLGSGDTLVPFGADASACIGVANVFRATFRDQLEDGRCDESWQTSLLDFDPRAQVLANPPFTKIDFEETHLVGLGAIGNGCVWTLSRLRGMRGTLHLVDDQITDLTNLQRYVLATDSDLGKPKVELAKAHLAETSLNVLTHPRRWGAYLAERGDWKLPTLAVAVDSAGDRQGIQAALPEWIVNAWTQIGDLGVSRHNFLGDQACLACLYLPTGPQKNEDELVAEAIGLPQDKLIVRKMLVTNEPLDRAYLTKIATVTKVELEELLQFEGQPLRSFYTQAVCGGVLLRLGAHPSTQRRVEVPMAFQSAFAGILLAAELVAKAAGLKNSPPPVTTKLDLLRPLGPYLSLPAPKHPAGNCICQDADYIAACRRKYAPLGK